MSESLDVVKIKSRCQKEFVRSFRPSLQHRLYTEDNTFHYRYSAYLLHYKYYLRLYEDQISSESVNEDIYRELLKQNINNNNNNNNNNSNLNVQISFLTTDLIDEDRNIMTICVENILNKRNDCITINMNSLKYHTMEEVFSDLVLKTLQCLQRFKTNHDSSSSSKSTYNHKSGHKFHSNLSNYDSQVLDLMNEVYELMILDPTSAFSTLVGYLASKQIIIYVIFPHAESIPYGIYRDMLELWKTNGYAYNTRIISIHASNCRIPLRAQPFIDFSLNRCTSVRSINQSFISRILCTRKLPSSIYSSLNNDDNNSNNNNNNNSSSNNSKSNMGLDMNLGLMLQDKCIRTDVQRAAKHYCHQFRNNPSLSCMYQESKWVGLLSRDGKTHHKVTDPTAITTTTSRFNSYIDRNESDQQTLSYIEKYVNDGQKQTEQNQPIDMEALYDQQLYTTISLRVKQVLFYFLTSLREYKKTAAYDNFDVYTIWFTGVSDIIDINMDDITISTTSTDTTSTDTNSTDTNSTTTNTKANLKRRQLELECSLSESLLYSMLMSVMLSNTTGDLFDFDSFVNLFHVCFSIMVQLSRSFGQVVLVQTIFTQLMEEVEVFSTLLPHSKKIFNLNADDQQWYQQLQEHSRMRLREKCIRNICTYIKLITTLAVSNSDNDTDNEDNKMNGNNNNDENNDYVHSNNNTYESFSNNFRLTFLRALDVPLSSSSSSSMEVEGDEECSDRDIAVIYRLISTSDEIKTVHEFFCEWQQETSSAVWPDDIDNYEDVRGDGGRRRKRKVDNRKPPANIRSFAQVQLHYRFLTVLHHLEHHGIIKVVDDEVHSLTHAWSGL